MGGDYYEDASGPARKEMERERVVKSTHLPGLSRSSLGRRRQLFSFIIGHLLVLLLGGRRLRV